MLFGKPFVQLSNAAALWSDSRSAVDYSCSVVSSSLRRQLQLLCGELLAQLSITAVLWYKHFIHLSNEAAL
jgi:hypothetical protein